MTPNEIEVFIHCYTRSTPHPRIDAPAVGEAINMLRRNGLIEPVTGENFYMATGKGKAYMKMLCSLPWPVSKWVDQNNAVIDADEF